MSNSVIDAGLYRRAIVRISSGATGRCNNGSGDGDGDGVMVIAMVPVMVMVMV